MGASSACMHPSSYDDFDDDRPHRPGVSTEFLERNGIKRVSAEEAHQRVGYRAAGTFIPYFHFFANGPVVVNGREFCRLRLDEFSSNGAKYLSPKGCGVELYIPSSPPFASADFVICEGEFKALSLCESGVRAAAIGGINGALPGGKLLPSLEKLVKKVPFKRVYFLGDGDTAFKWAFVLEAIKLARALERLRPGVQVLLPRAPLFAIRDNGADGGEELVIPNGIDDCRQDLNIAFDNFWKSVAGSAHLVDSKMGASALALKIAERTLGDIAFAPELKKSVWQTGLLEIASHLDAIDLSKLAQRASKIPGLSLGDFKKSASKRKAEERVRARVEREAAQEKKDAESSAGDSSVIQEVEPWPQPVNLSQVLSETVAVFRRYIWMSESPTIVVVLWSAATYLHGEFEIFPFLAITAPSKRCGKTTLFTLVSKFVPRALVLAGDVSAPFVFRAINAYAPALMLDEAQDAFKKNPDLASIYNAGHVKDTAYVGRVEKINEDLVPVRFNVFCPKVLALEGKIRDDSLQERVIEIRLGRMSKSDMVEGDYWDAKRELNESLLPLQQRFVRAALDLLPKIKDCRPEMPEFDNSRTKQNWKPPWIVAELAGGEWTAKLKEAINECDEEGLQEPSFSDYLLGSLKEFCENYVRRPSVTARERDEQRDHIPTDDILSPSEGLNSDKEAPWKADGKELTAERLAKELRAHRVKFHTDDDQ